MKKKGFLLFFLIIFAFPATGFAQTPILLCDINENQCECRGLFSDMSTAAGAQIIVKNDKGEVLLKKKLNREGEISFAQPDEHYTIIMNAGPGHETDPWDPEDAY
ncbi:MAG: hypothetical protein HUN05_12095 [Desulfobacter sp.]|nr:MAG: hypothetical protein HUN05_12095 [Desulfobacter sp.]